MKTWNLSLNPGREIGTLTLRTEATGVQPRWLDFLLLLARYANHKLLGNERTSTLPISRTADDRQQTTLECL